MKKQAFEDACRKAGMVPVRRTKILGAEVFIADGFSFNPHEKFARFGIEKGDFPLGAYATMWWVSKDDELDIGQSLFFDFMHDPEYGLSSKKTARINSAIQEAAGFLKRRKELAKEVHANA